MEEPSIPVQAQNMVRVTRDEFFAKMNPLDVHPNIEGRWQDLTGYTSVWKLRLGKIVGVSDSFGEGRYWLISEPQK